MTRSLIRRLAARSPWNSSRHRHGKREYVTGLGQCLTYLNSFDYALLVLPFEAIDGFDIATYLGETVRTQPLDQLPIGILAYKLGPDIDMQMVEALRVRTFKVPAPASSRSAFWGYWRDLSQYDVLDLLSLIDRVGGFGNAWSESGPSSYRLGKRGTGIGSSASRGKAPP